MRVLVITNYAPKNINKLLTIKPNDYVIIVDGALDNLNKKIKVDLVVGDFDSIKNKNRLRKYQTIKLPKEKDITDTYQAISHAYSISNDVILIGGIKGPRIEHFIANLMLLDKFKNLVIIDENSKISLLENGNHIITKGGYINFFAKEDSVISLGGFKYSLNNYHLKRFDQLAISNEIEGAYGEVKIKSGEVIVIETKEKR